MNDSVFVHVGLTKAASTTLQAFFTAHNSLGYIDAAKTVKAIVENSLFDLDVEKTKEFLSSEIELQRRQNKIPIISHERLSGNPHSGHYDAREIAYRLHEFIPGAKILLCIREQMGLMASCYKQYIRIGGIKKLKDYLLPVRDYRIPLFDWRFYEYHKIIQLYFDLFGAHNVGVLLLEELKTDPKLFYESLSRIMDIPFEDSLNIGEIHNPSITDSEIEYVRLTNFFGASMNTVKDPNIFSENFLNRLLYRQIKLSRRRLTSKCRDIEEEVRDLFVGAFRKSNLRTCGLISKDLRVFGYDLPDTCE
jgi:hypothetical protein